MVKQDGISRASTLIRRNSRLDCKLIHEFCRVKNVIDALPLASQEVILQLDKLDALLDGSGKSMTVLAKIAKNGGELSGFENELAETFPADFGLLEAEITWKVRV